MGAHAKKNVLKLRQKMTAYKLEDKIIKRMARKDKKKLVNGIETEAEEAAKNGKTRQMFQRVNEICNRNGKFSAIPLKKEEENTKDCFTKELFCCDKV